MAKSNKYDSYTKDELIDELETLKKKKYGLVWDKKNSQEILDIFINWENVPENFVPKQFPILKEVKNKEIENKKDQPINLLIEGDNYHSLAVLNFTHQETISLIYIDPPYNTGNNDFIYNDKIIDKEDGFRHSKWLSFMEKRLKLAKNLLKKDGVIFISIDDNEQAPLKMLCDEVFGENNFISCITVYSNPRGRQSSSDVALTHEYLLVYSKSDLTTLGGEKLSSEKIQEYNHKDKRGIYREIGLRLRGGRATAEEAPTLHFPIYVNPKTSEISLEAEKGYIKIIPKFEDGTLGTWRWSKRKIIEDIGELLARPVRIKDGSRWDIFQKDYLTEDKTLKVKSVWLDREINYDNGADEIKDLFHKKVFDYAKPTALIKKIINIATDQNSLVLDFMAGSGTTGNAVLQLNKEDGGSRRFILCTNNENNICTDVCYPRLEKIINGYKNLENKTVDGLGGNLKYFKTDFVGSDANDKNKRDLVKQSTEMICIKEDIFDLVIDEKFDFKIYQKGKKFLGVVFDIDSLDAFKAAAEKCKGSFSVYCFSYNETTPEKEFKNLNNEYTFKPIPAVILKVYLEIFKK